MFVLQWCCSCLIPRRRAGEARWHQDSPEWSEVQGCNMSKAVGENQSNSYLWEYPHPDDFVPAGKAERKGQTPELNPCVALGTCWGWLRCCCKEEAHIGVGSVAADKGWKTNCCAIRKGSSAAGLWPSWYLEFSWAAGWFAEGGQHCLGEFGQLVSPFSEPQVISEKSRLAISW